MRILLVLLLALTAACSASADASDEPAAAAAAPRGEAVALAAWRTDLQHRCVEAIRTLAGPSPLVPAEGQCACTLDRMTAGKTLAELRADERSGRQEQTFIAALQQCMMETLVGAAR